MHERPSQIISFIASNAAFSRERIAVTLLSTYSGAQRRLAALSDIFFPFEASDFLS